MPLASKRLVVVSIFKFLITDWTVFVLLFDQSSKTRNSLVSADAFKVLELLKEFLNNKQRLIRITSVIMIGYSSISVYSLFFRTS